MSKDIGYCTSCGAANEADTTTCFACGDALKLSTGDEGKKQANATEELLHGRYRLLGPAGEGGFARVYRAEDVEQHKIVAIKAIRLKALSSQERIDATDTYNREIHFGTTLEHPALPAICDHFADQDHWYIVAEFIEGQTLEEYVQCLPQKRLPIWEVLEIGVQVCDVLTYLHSRQPPVIFRDVKPD